MGVCLRIAFFLFLTLQQSDSSFLYKLLRYQSSLSRHTPGASNFQILLPFPFIDLHAQCSFTGFMAIPSLFGVLLINAQLDSQFHPDLIFNIVKGKHFHERCVVTASGFVSCSDFNKLQRRISRLQLRNIVEERGWLEGLVLEGT